MENFLFILGCHKSGTTLLRSLFDGTNNYFSIPIEAHFFENLRWWINYPMVRTKDSYGKKIIPSDILLSQFKDNVKNWIYKYNRNNDKYSDAMPRGAFNEIKFNECINNIRGSDKKEWIEGYIKAIYFSLFNSQITNDKIVVEKSVENAEFALELSTMFPLSKFVHIIRNPYANIVSIRKYYNKATKSKFYPNLTRFIKAIQHSYYYLYKNKRLLKNYYLLRYEDLINNPDKEIFKICNELNLPYEDNLFKPTYLGDPWRGNSTKRHKFDGISNKNMNSWRKEIESVEIEIINRRLSHVMRDFNYGYLRCIRSPYLPAKKEALNYIINRCLLNSKF